MSFNRQSEIKLSQFREDIKNEKIFERKMNYLIKNEFDATLNDILQLEPDSFIERIEKGISFSLENIYSEECLSDQKLISIIRKLINKKKTEYSNIVLVLKDTWNTYEKILKRRPHQEYLLSNFRKHCVNTEKLARHNCGSNNSYFLTVKNKQNKINFVICESCKKVYYSSYISCFCNFCNIDYYSGILNDDENPNFLVATWENYHCPQIINEKMRCIKCRELFYLDMKNGILTCLNKKCGFSSKPSRILWICTFCQEEFNSNAITYNPLSMIVVKKAITQTLLLKHRAHPNKMTCCKLNVFFTEFLHKKSCKGILYEGELNDNMIIVCEKCQAINFYERFIWTCPQCNKKFRDIKNDDFNKNLIKNSIDKKNDEHHNYKNNNNNINGLNKKKEKSRSVCKEDYRNKYRERYIERFKERSKEKFINEDIEIKRKNNLNQEEIVKNMINNIEEKKEINNYNLKLKYESPKRRNFYRRGDYNSSKLIKVKNETQKERCFKIIIKNDGNENNIDNKNQNNINVLNNFLAKSSANGFKYDYKKKIISERNKEYQKELLNQNKKEEKKQETNNDNDIQIGKKRSNTAYDKTPKNNENRRYFYYRPNEEEKKKEKNEIEKNEIEKNEIEKKIFQSDFSRSNNVLIKMDGIPKKERYLKRYISVENLNIKKQEKNNNINNNNKTIVNNNEIQIQTPQKNVKKSRFCSVEYKRTNENKEEDNQKDRIQKNFHITPYNRKLTKEDENMGFNHRKNKIRFHVSLNKSKEDNKEEKQEDEDKEDKEEIKKKRFIRFRVNHSQNKEKKEIEYGDIHVEEDDDQENKNTKESSNLKTNGRQIKEEKEKEEKEKQNYRRFCSSNYMKNEKISDLEMKEGINKDKDKNINKNKDIKDIKDNKDNKNNKDNICPNVPDNIGLENLVGLAHNLLSHSKRRINNIFAKMKIPIFNIEDYKIEKKLGEGSYGIIYSVTKINEKNPVYALKKIIARTVSEVCTFIKEFELVYTCQHSNIMKIYGLCLRILDATTFTIYVLMEKSKYDWDKEIKSYLSKRKIYSEKELIEILRQLTEALLFLKNKFNISHRDIKPQNILVFDNGIYKLADFGEAKEIKISKQLNTLRGTELYMSPALYEGLKREKNDVSHDTFKSDVFSLGFCLLFAAGLNFNLLYQIRDITNNSVTEKTINNHLKKMYSNKFIQILCKMLKVDEIQRYGFTEILEYINNNYNKDEK